MNTVYIMCGPIGCGKSHIANILFNGLNNINPDSLRSKDWDNKSSNIAWDIVHKTISSSIKNGIDFVVDSAQALEISRKRLTQFIREQDALAEYEIVCIFVKADFATCLKRNNERGRTESVSVVQEYYTNVMNNPPSRHDGYDRIIVVDNSDYSGNSHELWTTDEPWPKDWYHGY